MARIGMDPKDWIAEFTDSFEAFETKEVLCGIGKWRERSIALYAHDPKVGFISSVGAEEILNLMKKAESLKIPLVCFLASPGVSVEEGILSGDAYTKVISKTIELSGYIPQIAMVMGTTMGAPAYSATLMDFVLFNKARSTLMVTGPAVIEKVIGQKTTIKDLGGSVVHSEKTGIADLVAKNIKDQIDSLKELLELLPENCSAKTEITKDEDPREKIKLPTGSRQAYDMHGFLKGVLDGSRLFEIKRSFAKSMITGLARIEGRVVAVVANQSTHQAGAIDYLAARKAARFIRLMDSFNIPLINFIDVPGFMPGEHQEHNGLLRYGAQLCQSMHTTTPRLSIVVRRCYGAAAFLMMQTKSQGGDYVLALKDSSVAIMGYAGAKTMIYPDDGIDRSEEYYQQYEDPAIAKKLGIIDEVITADQARSKLAMLLQKSENKKYPKPLNKKQVSLI